MKRVPFEEYYMLVALAVRERANCVGRKVGAIIVRENRIISSGYNGTPDGMVNCEAGGCARCSLHRKKGEWYDKCVCVHAEQNAMISAARFGNSIRRSVVYTTLQPCFSCLKEMLQAEVLTVYYLDELGKPKRKNDKADDFDNQYEVLKNRFEKVPKQLDKKNIKMHWKNIGDNF